MLRYTAVSAILALLYLCNIGSQQHLWALFCVLTTQWRSARRSVIHCPLTVRVANLGLGLCGSVTLFVAQTTSDTSCGGTACAVQFKPGSKHRQSPAAWNPGWVSSDWVVATPQHTIASAMNGWHLKLR